MFTATEERARCLFMGSNARRLVITLWCVQPAAFQYHIGNTGRDVPEHIAVAAFNWLCVRTDLGAVALANT